MPERTSPKKTPIAHWQYFVPFGTNSERVKKTIFRALASINKAVLPSLTKKQLDLARAKKWQLVLLGWRYYVTKNAIDQ